MTAIFVTGAAGTLMQTGILAETAKLLAEQSQAAQMEASIGFPTPSSTPQERLQMTTVADVVVLVKGWEADRLARQDAQVAVWCGKIIRHDLGLRKANKGLGNAVEVALVDYPHDKVQELLDRGLRLSMFEDTAAVKPDPNQPGVG